MDSAFLQASLFTSVVAFGVAGMAFVLGIVLTLIGFALRAPATSDGLVPVLTAATGRGSRVVGGGRPCVGLTVGSPADVPPV